MSTLTSIVVALVAITCVESTRLSTEHLWDDVVFDAQCTASSENGMSVTWGLPHDKCIEQCGPTTSIGSREAPTYEWQFANAFQVSLNIKCECKIAGKTMVTFMPFHDGQARHCAEGTSMAIKEQCWKIYMKARGTRFEQAGNFKVSHYQVPFKSGDFVVKRNCKKACKDDTCPFVTMPGALDGMDDSDKAAVGEAIKFMKEGKQEEVDAALKDLIEILSEEDLDSCEFAAIDVEKDGHLTKDELSNFYIDYTPKQIQQFLESADINDDVGTIERDEFIAFKDAMRNYNSQARWQVVSVECMKDGKPAPGQCDNTAEEAIATFNTEC